MPSPEANASPPLRIAVIGHVEHVTLGRARAFPQAGDIVHLDRPTWIPGGGGGVAFYQLLRGPAEIHLFTAIGQDEAGAQVEARLRETSAHLHLARRNQAHTRDVVLVDPTGERTIFVLGRPLHPSADDPLPWDMLADMDAVYFTAEDPRVLRYARAARKLVVSARRRESLDAAAVPVDALLGSRSDPRENAPRSAYRPPPHALVLTEGSRGGTLETKDGSARFSAPADVSPAGGAYGAGDSFAGAFVHFLARGLSAIEAAGHAAPFGAAALASLDTLSSQKALP